MNLLTIYSKLTNNIVISRLSWACITPSTTSYFIIIPILLMRTFYWLIWIYDTSRCLRSILTSFILLLLGFVRTFFLALLFIATIIFWCILIDLCYILETFSCRLFRKIWTTEIFVFTNHLWRNMTYFICWFIMLCPTYKTLFTDWVGCRMMLWCSLICLFICSLRSLRLLLWLIRICWFLHWLVILFKFIIK